MKIAIQGKDGSYHSQAARGVFGDDIEMIDGGVFGGVFDLVESGEVDYGVVAIENSIFGTIRSVYDLLLDRELHMVGEAYVKINHVLAGIEPVDVKNIKTISSQREAIAACTKWINYNLPNAQLQYGRDTAESLQNVANGTDKTVAAIGSKQAALDLGLNIIAENIADEADSDTRFVVISSKPDSFHGEVDKLSILLRLPAQSKGSLVASLQVIADFGVSMDKIESRPEPGRKWGYMFYIDLEISDIKIIQPLIEELNLIGSSVEAIGAYKKASLIFGSS